MSLEVHSDVRHKSFYEHPKLRELESCGIKAKDTNEHAVLVYLHLIEVQFWFDVDLIPISSKQIVFIKGRRKENVGSFDYVLPISSSSVFICQDLHLYIDLAQEHGCEQEEIMIAFVNDNAAVMYYKISNGLVPPNKPSNKEIMKMNRIPEWNDKKGKWRT